MKRFPFLDWMRGLALVIMIECHAFNSFARMDVRGGGLYSLSQFAGGMAGPLFLFMAGITVAFLMEKLEGRELTPRERWLACLRRAGYILAVAFLIRLTGWITSWPHGGWEEITRVDILNSMGLAMLIFSLAALLRGARRIHTVLLAALTIAAVSPVVANFNWAAAPPLVHEYLAPGMGAGHFPFFPCASYLGFGMTMGSAIRHTEEGRLDRIAQWSALIGGMLILGGQYVSNLPYSVYPKSNFWTDNPVLILMRVGISTVVLAGCYVWTAYCAGPGWSFMQLLGRHSLVVYWVHLMLVYGVLTAPLQHALSIPATFLATVVLIALMVALAAVSQAFWSYRSRKGSKAPSPPLQESGSTRR